MAMAIPTLRSIRARAVDVPMARPLGTSAQTMRTAPILLIDLHCEDDIVGRAYLFCYARMAPRLIATVLDDIAEALCGERIAPVDFAQRLLQRYRLLGAQGVVRMALAGFDVACWDALSQAAGMPLADFIGSRTRPIPAYNSNGLGLMPPEQAADEAEALLEGGFRAVKLRLGRPTAEADLAVVRAVRRRLPDAVALMADYNQALTVTEAIRRGRALDGEGLSWIEEPVRHDDYAGCARIADALATPVQIGENFAGATAMATALAAGACDYVMPDLERIGGVTGWQRAAALAAAAGIEMSSHIFPEVSAHLLAATPTCHWLEYVDWAAPILAEPMRIVDGMAVVSDRPGTGIAWNEDAVARYLIA
ncbi:mandelate racemase/muconate lactonizing protein [Acidisphaera rubrifaciens HS-AP3]|uniref:Mandelate racemase/muconate lactonizing protein n=2 Tax=Acidisphaera TaxID=50714 RepID=A0A0D6P4K8_9PROT|nr:mandelate racemase/muconate lactonizing protein [Acidisphaera rubrifaciens HS-AP3]